MSKKKAQHPVSDHGFGGKAASGKHQKPKKRNDMAGRDNNLYGVEEQLNDTARTFGNE